MLVKVFLETAGNFEEREILTKFYNGIVNAANSNTQASLDLYNSYSPCDVGVILGSWKPRDKTHHNVRNDIVENVSTFIVIETPLLGRVVNQQNTQHRIGINGFLNQSGIFNHGNHKDSRVKKLGIEWNGWKHDPNGHILLMLQLPGDASLRGINLYEWVDYAINKIRLATDRPIVIRTHPAHGIKSSDEFHSLVSSVALSNLKSNVSFSIGRHKSFEDDISGAYCSVAYSSGSSIDSVLHGIPTVAVDPGNFAWDISTNYLDEIETVKLATQDEINQWLNNLSYSQWSPEEMYDGTAWKHLASLIRRIANNKK
jgi:hypothetical protein